MRVNTYVVGALLLLATGEAAAACSFGRGSGEASLQSVFDQVLGSGALDAAADCVSAADARVWSAPAEAVATIIVELAGFAPQNRFGIYQGDESNNRITLFDGADGAGAGSTVRFVASGAGYQVSVNGKPQGEIGGTQFGFFLAAPTGDVFFSDPARNPDGANQLYAYRGTNGAFIGGPLAGQSFASSMYLLAFEDLPARRGDRDFQDFVGVVNFIAHVPLPAGGWLLGVAIALLARWNLRHMRRGRVLPATKASSD